MGEDTNLPSGSGGHPCGDDVQVLHQAGVYQQEADSVGTVVLDPKDVTFLPFIPMEAQEEVIMYDGSQEEIKVEVVCSGDYQNSYPEEYSQQRAVKKKSQNKSSRDRVVHKCRVCSKTFNQVVNLVTHQRIHTGEKPYKCSVCTKPFSQQPNLWKHMRIHTGERPYQCGTCKKTFSQQANLTKHNRIHTGERPYACQYCGQRFTQQANLTKHVRLHTGERPFICRFCSKSFVQQSNLERHERTHTGVKPFKCQVCHDSFTQNAHLSKHLRTIHKNQAKPYCIKIVNQSKGGLSTTHSEEGSQPDTASIQQYDEKSSKKVGIPVLYCTKTGRILRRVD